MPIETDDELVKRLGHLDMSIYQKRFGKKPYDYTPHCIYFYYVRINKDGGLAVDHYFFGHDSAGKYSKNPQDWVPIKPQEVAGLTKQLALNARPTGKKLPRRIGRNFEEIVWNRRSHIVFFFDEKKWSFHTESSKVPAVVFKTDLPGDSPNHAFFDAEDMLIEFGDDDTRSAVRFINHMTKNEAGDLFGHADRSDYKMDFLLRVDFAKGSDKKLTVIFDPPGGNEGPPGQP
jgi:hypothetical protein